MDIFLGNDPTITATIGEKGAAAARQSRVFKTLNIFKQYRYDANVGYIVLLISQTLGPWSFLYDFCILEYFQGFFNTHILY